jgi:hypothetical protein
LYILSFFFSLLDAFEDDSQTQPSSQDDHTDKLFAVTRQFVLGMCKNQGTATRPVPLLRIHMMLPMVMPKVLK